MYYYIAIKSLNKAKNDIDELMRRRGFKDASVGFRQDGMVNRYMHKLLSMVKLLFMLRKGDVLLIQYPFKKFFVCQCLISRMKGARTVTLIHDLGTFRRHRLTASQEVRRLSHTDYIIVHNPSMMKWLQDNGCNVPMGSLDIFDYLSDLQPHCYEIVPPFTHVIYAGGLGKRKNAFIYNLDSLVEGCRIDLYGKGKLEVAAGWRNISFCGSKQSDRFISEIEGDWGLVWDGDSTEECSGNWGEYLRINNPHKASFYLRAGLPVIVWKESAMASFVKERGIGICIGSLSQLPEILGNISEEEYMKLRSNAREMKDLLQNGSFFNKAFDKALEMLTK